MNHDIQLLEKILYQWQTSVINFLPQLFLAIVVFVLFFLIAKFARKYSLTFYQKTIKKHTDLAHVVSSAFYFFFILSGSLLALQIIGLEQFLTKLLAGAGIAGIIAGFAFKDVASNMFAGMLLKMQQPFRVGDWVDIDNAYGTICEIGWITTVIKTISGQKVFVPNQLVYNNTFTNYSTFQKRRVILETGVSYGDDLEKVRAVALDEARKLPDILVDDPIDFYFTNIGSSTYNFELRFWINFHSNDDYRRAMSNVIMGIKKRFEQEDISIAYSVTTLDFAVKGGVNLFDKPIITRFEKPDV